jgi:hypothetical protein
MGEIKKEPLAVPFKLTHLVRGRGTALEPYTEEATHGLIEVALPGVVVRINHEKIAGEE